MDPAVEQQILQVYDLDRAGCTEQLLHMEQLKLDFTTEYLSQISIEQLRHLLVAAYLQVTKKGLGHR